MVRTMAIAALVLAAACGGGSRRAAGDGGTSDRDAGDDGIDGGGVTCGGELCGAGEVCCVDCDGVATGCSVACPGAACPPEDAGTGGACRGEADCSASEYCLLPGATPPCGIGCMVERTCASDADCSEGNVCIEALGPCCYPGDELSSSCVPACTTGSCGDGFTCGTDGRCAAVSCEEGYECPARHTCTGTGDVHGCSRNTCTTDGDCADAGYCVSGACYDGLGTCTPPSA